MMGLGETTLNDEISKTAGAVLNGGKKRQSKSAPTKPPKPSDKLAWGKLLSQCSQVGVFCSSFMFFPLFFSSLVLSVYLTAERMPYTRIITY